MSSNHDQFIVYDEATGDILRSGSCPLGQGASQARAERGEAVVLGTEPLTHTQRRQLHIEQRVVRPANGRPYLRRRAAADIEARRPRSIPSAPTMSTLIKVLKEKHGIDVTPADLTAAQSPRPEPPPS